MFDQKKPGSLFDKHMKTCIALQLILDSLPFLLLAVPFAVAVIDVNLFDDEMHQLPFWLDALAAVCLLIVMYGGAAVLFILGIWSRRCVKVEFACYPKCKKLSAALRVLGFIPAVISLGFAIGCVFYYFKNL